MLSLSGSPRGDLDRNNFFIQFLRRLRHRRLCRASHILDNQAKPSRQACLSASERRLLRERSENGAKHEVPPQSGEARREYEDPLPRGGIVSRHVRYRAHRLAVLDDRRAPHKCGQVGTTKFVIFLIVLFALSISPSVGILLGRVLAIPSASYFDPA